MKAKTLRIRMMLLFTTVVGVLLAGSYLAFWGLLAHEVPTQLNRQLLETARPLIADIVTEPNAKDVNRLDIPGEFFELLDSTGRVLQRSRNVTAAIDLNGISPAVSRPTFGIATIGHAQSVRIALVPFQQGNQTRILVVAIQRNQPRCFTAHLRNCNYRARSISTHCTRSFSTRESNTYFGGGYSHTRHQ